MSDAAPSGDPPRVFVAMVLPTLSSGQRVAPSEALQRAFRVALEWQTRGQDADLAEAGAVSTMGAAPGRVFELIGRVAAAGEQLGLAGTCLLEAEGWLNSDAVQHTPGATDMAVRALAEMVGYYALSTAQGLINVTLRTLLASPHGPKKADTIQQYRRAAALPPFTPDRKAWIFFNKDAVKWLRSVVAITDDPTVTQWFDPVAQLLDDDRWTALTNRRHEDFHRWRPQSLSTGVEPRSPWEPDPGGGATLSIGGIGSGSYQPVAPQVLVDEAAAAVGALTTVMETWMLLWPRTLNNLGCPIFQD